MATLKNYSIEAIASLFTKANWDYTYNMQRIDEPTMQDLLSTLDNSTFTIQEVEKAVDFLDQVDIDAFDNQSETADINIYIGWLIADRLAQVKVDCPYETVIFQAAL